MIRLSFTEDATRAYLSRGSRQEIVNLLVDSLCPLQILDTTNLSLDKMVTVDSGRHSGRVHARGHELEDGHLVSARMTSGRIHVGDSWRKNRPAP